MSLAVVASLHGSYQLREDVVVYWDRDKRLQRERRDVMEGTVFRVTPAGGSMIIIALFGEPPPDTIAHELSHANVLDVGIPHVLDEGLATLCSVLFEQGWYAHAGNSNEAINQLWRGEIVGIWGKYMSTMPQHQPGLEPRAGTIIPYHPVSLYQYALACRTLFDFLQVASMRPQPYTSYFGEFIKWVQTNPNPSLEACAEHLKKLAKGFPGERWEELSLFAPTTEGVFAFVAAMPQPSDQGVASGGVTAGLVIGYRDSQDQIPSFMAVIETPSKGQRRAAIPQGGFVGPFKDVATDDDPWIRVWKEGEPQKAVTIPLRQHWSTAPPR
ncbi:MAG: hypothetical protein HY461_03115 [Parcubacteria group bacterium]|nr:hypothetical protein [Parcubacteria group bacterium]